MTSPAVFASCQSSGRRLRIRSAMPRCAALPSWHEAAPFRFAPRPAFSPFFVVDAVLMRFSSRADIDANWRSERRPLAASIVAYVVRHSMAFQSRSSDRLSRQLLQPVERLQRGLGGQVVGVDGGEGLLDGEGPAAPMCDLGRAAANSGRSVEERLAVGRLALASSPAAPAPRPPARSPPWAGRRAWPPGCRSCGRRRRA